MTAETPRFIHLRVRTALSLLQSMIRPKDLAKWAAAGGVPAVGVTDENLFAALELADALADAGVEAPSGCGNGGLCQLVDVAPVEKLDLLFVVDNSSSMAAEQAALWQKPLILMLEADIPGVSHRSGSA